jgi:hypothetical protein
LNRGFLSVWLLIPLIYFLGWWQTGSLRQAFNGTVAWIIAYAIVAGTLLILDIGGLSGMTATPDSPAAGIAILGGFIGMWISNYFWRRRGGDPPRKMGKWERSFRAIIGKDKKKKKKKRPAMQQPAPQQQMPPPPTQQQPVAAAPIDADYRPAGNPAPQPASHQPRQQPVQPQPVHPAPPTQQEAPPQQQPAYQPQYQQAYASPPPSNGGHAPQQQAPAPTRKKNARRNSPTADKYAKATGRALGAMFRGSDKKKSKE